MATKSEPIGIEINRQFHSELFCGYTVMYTHGRDTYGSERVSDIYRNEAKEIDGEFILTEDGGKPFCKVDNREAADNALYHLAMMNAKEKLERLKQIKIEDLTTKLK